MLKIVTVIGARPQIIKAAAFSRAIRQEANTSINEVIIHTGQHYDSQMSSVFFEELHIPHPQYNLNVGSGSHGVQTSKIIQGLEEALLLEKPDYVVVYGDTNSTLAAALAASKIQIPIVHIEAGLRSFNKAMPEEINRIVCDHVSTILFPPTQTGMQNLQREGFETNTKPPFTIDKPGIFNVGDVMYDNALYFSKLAAERSDIIERNGLSNVPYILATIHRNANTDASDRLSAIIESILAVCREGHHQVVLPLHPRTHRQMSTILSTHLWTQASNEAKLRIIPPVSYLDMLQLEMHAALIMTDSGGVQKESYFLSKPCIILRGETEWVEIVKNGAAILCDADSDKIWSAYVALRSGFRVSFDPVYGEGDASSKMIKVLLNAN